MNERIARAVSIALHPVVTAPAAGLAAWSLSGGSWGLAWRGLAAWAALVLVVMGFSWRRVRAGRWVHVDASGPGERRQLNGFLSVALSIATLGLWAGGAARPSIAGLAAAAAIVVASAALARWCKPSLHVAFAVYAAAILHVASPAAAMVAAGAAVLVGWSRLVLGRHVPIDVLAGVLIGLAAGTGFRIALAG